MHNLYWTIYKNLEKELIALTNVINFDDDQLTCYSSKLVDLLLRTCVEIESISKQLYLTNNSAPIDDEAEMYFDTVCLDYLNDIFHLESKTIFVCYSNVYFIKSENIELRPLYKSNKRGSSGADWKKAYQAVKHNRSANYKRGNLKNVIRALGALYILNLYNNNQTFKMENLYELNHFDESIGSEFFSVKINKAESTIGNIHYVPEAIYNVTLSRELLEKGQKELDKINATVNELVFKEPLFIKAIADGINPNQFDDWSTALSIMIGEERYHQILMSVVRESDLINIMQNQQYMACLNK